MGLCDPMPDPKFPQPDFRTPMQRKQWLRERMLEHEAKAEEHLQAAAQIRRCLDATTQKT